MQWHGRERLPPVSGMMGVEKQKKKSEKREEKRRQRERLEKATRFDIVSDRCAGCTGNS